MKKRLLLVLPLALALTGGVMWWRAAEEPVSGPNTAAVTRGDLASTVLATGSLEAAQLVSVGARVSGQIETLGVDLGDRVEKGQQIAQIDSQDQSNAVLEAQASLAQISAQIEAQKATITEAELLVQRRTKLNSNNLTSTEDLQTAIAQLAVARADLDALKAQKTQAEISVATAETELERTKITAPITGTVVAVVTKQGSSVNANTSSPTLVKLAELDRMVVKAEISEADIVKVQPGQTASFTLSGAPDMHFDATLRAIEPAPEAIEDDDTISTDEAIYYNALLDVENPEGILRIGMTAEVTIELARADNVLTVPAAALGQSRRDGKRVVQVWDAAAGRAEPREVTVGLNTNVTAEITDGLKEGELVVIGSGQGAAKAAGSSGSRRSGPPMMGF